MLSRRKLIKAGVVAGGVGLAGCLGDDDDNGDDGAVSGDDDGDDPEEVPSWQMATSVDGGPQFIVGVTIEQQLNDIGALDGVVDFQAIEAPGADAGFRMMDDGDVQLSGPAAFSLEMSPDDGPFEASPIANHDDVRQLFTKMSFDVGQMVVHADSGLETWEDLEGKTISLGDRGSASAVPLETLVDHEIGLDNVNAEFVTWSEQAAALRAGQVDAITQLITNSEVVGGLTQEMDATIDWEPINISERGQQLIEEEMPYAEVTTLDAGELGFESYQGELILMTLGYPVIGMADLDADAVYEFTKACQENRDLLMDASNLMGFFGDPDRNLGNLHPDIPVHLGAYNYYVDEGLWDDYDLTPPPEA